MKQYIQHWARIVESIENDCDFTDSYEDEQLNDSAIEEARYRGPDLSKVDGDNETKAILAHYDEINDLKTRDEAVQWFFDLLKKYNINTPASRKHSIEMQQKRNLKEVISFITNIMLSGKKLGVYGSRRYYESDETTETAETTEVVETEDSEVNEARSKVTFDEDKYYYEVSITPETYYNERDNDLDSAFYNITPNGKVDVSFGEPPKTGTYYTSRDMGVSNATPAQGKMRIQHKDVLRAIINKFNMSNKYKTIIIFREGYSTAKIGGYAGKNMPRRTSVIKGYKWEGKTVQSWNGSMTLDEIFDTLKDGLPRTRRKAASQANVPEVNADEKIQAGLVRIDKMVTAGAKSIAERNAKKENNLAYTDSVSGIWRNYLDTGSAAYKFWTELKSKYGDEAVTKAAIAYDDAQKR